MGFWKNIKVNQSGATIGINRVDNLNVDLIAGKVVNHDKSSDDDSDSDSKKSTGQGQSIAIGFSESVWVNGKRVR
jgi:hypothetical protein